MAKHIEKGKVIVTAELQLTSASGVEVVQRHDAAWARAMELDRPVNVMFIGFTRA